MANPTKMELIEKLRIKGYDSDAVDEAFVEVYGVTPENMTGEGPLPSPKGWMRPFEQDETPRTLRLKEEQRRLAAEEAAAASRQKIKGETQGQTQPPSEAGETGFFPAVAGAVAGAAEGISDVGGIFYGMPEKTEKAYDESIARQEAFLRTRVGQSEYQNLYRDAWDLIGLIPNIGSLIWGAVTEGDSYEKSRQIAKSFVGDAYMAYPYIAQNFERSMRAAPLTTVLTLIPMFKAVKGVAKLGPGAPKLEALNSKVSKLLDTEVSGTLKGRTKFRHTGEDVKPGIYEHSLGERGVTYRDMLKSGAVGGTAGLLMGGTLPASAAAAFIAGAGLRPLLGKLAKTGHGAAFANKMGRLLGGISSNMKVGHELAMRNLFAKGPEAEAKLQGIGAQIAKRIREGDDILDAELVDMARAAFPELIADVEYGPSGRKYDVKGAAVVGERSGKRRKLSGEFEADLKSAETLLEGLLGSNRTSRTMALMDDILSEGSVQFGRADDVRSKALAKIEKDIGRKLAKPERASLARTMESIAETPFHREAGINLNLHVGNKAFNLRNLVTEAHRSLKPERRRKITAGLAADIITSNRNQIRKQAFARAASESADAHTRRLGLDPVKLAKMDERGADKLFAMRVMEDVVVNRGSVPHVGPTGINMALGGAMLRSVVDNTPDAITGALAKKLGRKLTDGEQAAALRRAKEVADDLADSEIKDIASEGARAAEGYYGDVERGSIYDRMEELAKDGLLDKNDIKKVESFFKSVDNSKNVIKDNRSMRGPLIKAFGWLHNSADHSDMGRVSRMIGAHIKGSYTTRNLNAHINNGMSNIGLLSYDRGITPMQVMHSILKNARAYSAWTKGNSAGLTGRQKRMMKQIDRAGFAAGDITRTEIQNLERMARMPDRWRNNSTLARAMETGVVRGAKKIDDVAAATYRWGDVGPKIDEAIRSMNAVLDRVDSMVDGQTWEFRTSPVSTTVVTRRGNGLYIGKKKIGDFVTRDGKVFAKSTKLDDLAGQHGRTRANERFFDYRDRPGALRFLDKFGGIVSYVNPYLTWAWKAMGIGGEGLFSVVNKIGPEYLTNNLKAAAREDFSSAARWYRRSMAAQGLREQFSKNPAAMRDALGFSDTPGSPLPVLIGRMAGPDVVQARSLESMNPFSRELLKWETLLGVGQDAIIGIAPGLMTKGAQQKRTQKQLLQETRLSERLLKLGMLTGGPAQQLVEKITKGKYPSARDYLALVIGQTPALGFAGARQALGGEEDSAFVMINERLPEDARPAALDFYFRKMLNWGWDKEMMVKSRNSAQGRIDRYFAGIKRRMSDTYFGDLITDYRRGKISNDQMVEAERVGQAAYRERVKEVGEAYELVTGKSLPGRLYRPPKLDYKKANRR